VNKPMFRLHWNEQHRYWSLTLTEKPSFWSKVSDADEPSIADVVASANQRIDGPEGELLHYPDTRPRALVLATRSRELYGQHFKWHEHGLMMRESELGSPVACFVAYLRWGPIGCYFEAPKACGSAATPMMVVHAMNRMLRKAESTNWDLTLTADVSIH